MLSTPVGIVGNISTELVAGDDRNGRRWVQFNLATKQRERVNGTWQDSEATFHQVVAFGKAAEATERTFVKGDRVSVVGEYQVTPYTDNEGNRRQGSQIVATSVAADPLFTNIHIDRLERGTGHQLSAKRAAEQSTGPSELATAARDEWAHYEQQPAAAGQAQDGPGLS